MTTEEEVVVKDMVGEEDRIINNVTTEEEFDHLISFIALFTISCI